MRKAVTITRKGRSESTRERSGNVVYIMNHLKKLANKAGTKPPRVELSNDKDKAVLSNERWDDAKIKCIRFQQ